MNIIARPINITLIGLLVWAGNVHAQADKDASELAELLSSARQNGSPPAGIAQQADVYWKTNFEGLRSKITPEQLRPDELLVLLEKYDQRAGNNLPPDVEQLRRVTDEAQAGGRFVGIGGIADDRHGTLRALQGAMTISLAASNGRTINEILSVLSDQRQPTAADLLVFRMFSEGQTGIGDNTFKLSLEQRKYAPADFGRLAELARHPNPVARLIAIEMLQYIPNAKENATPALAAMMRGMKSEDNPAIIKRVIDRANRQRSKVYEEVLPELSLRVETSNPKLKDEAQRVIKAIEETPASP